MPRGRKKPVAIDLFSGCGGLTMGLKKAGFLVVAGVEYDPLASETYLMNHPRVRLYQADIAQVDPERVLADLALVPGQLDLLAGCPPCQGFSTMRTRNGAVHINEPKNDLVFDFLRFARVLRPRLMMMENVPGLAHDVRMETITTELKNLGYGCKTAVFNAVQFGAPQRRRRMILIAAHDAEPIFAPPSARLRTVRGTLGGLLEPSQSLDPLHNYEVRRSPQVQKVIESIPADGGSRRSLPNDLRLRCHDESDGFNDVYGRMAWSEPAPTITGGCINPSKGRFLHPTQDRAITLREAALLQGFPKNYRFSLAKGRYPAAQMIGNAFPPIFATKHALELRKLI